MATVSDLQHRVSQMRCGKAETFNLSDLTKDVVSLGGTVGDVFRWLDYNQFHRCPGIEVVKLITQNIHRRLKRNDA